jgi:hypothetical protein
VNVYVVRNDLQTPLVGGKNMVTRILRPVLMNCVYTCVYGYLSCRQGIIKEFRRRLPAGVAPWCVGVSCRPTDLPVGLVGQRSAFWTEGPPSQNFVALINRNSHP